MKHALVIAVALIAMPAYAQEKKQEDKMAKVFVIAPDQMFGTMGRAIAAKWKVTHTDKDLCLVTFEQAGTMTSSGFDATASCEPAEGGTRVRIKGRQKGTMSLKGKEEGLAKNVFSEIDRAIERK